MGYFVSLKMYATAVGLVQLSSKPVFFWEGLNKHSCTVYVRRNGISELRFDAFGASACTTCVLLCTEC